MRENKYKWWTQRIKFSFYQYDILRIDHFRGFEAYWEIPANNPTAKIGRWVKGPGETFFRSLNQELGNLPIVVEDLGFITPEVDILRKKFGFPGMKLIQNAFDDNEDFNSENENLPHCFDENFVVYLGTHDNETALGWWKTNIEKKTFIPQHVKNYLNSDGKEIVADLIRLAWSSVARISIIQMQDLLRLDNSARMNIPATTENNWVWRFTWNQLKDEMGEELMQLNKLYDR